MKRSAGNSGFIGRISLDAQAASWMQLFDGSSSVFPVRSEQSSDASIVSGDYKEQELKKKDNFSN